jgi:hypothetical protein
MDSVVIDIGPTRLFARRGPRLISVGVTPFGLNLHRLGGISLTGLPRSGGTTVCWGGLRERCDRMDGEALARTGELVSDHTEVRCFGPLMIRVGRDF